MGTEIERRFLVSGPEWRPLVVSSHPCEQGYVAGGGKASVRVRLMDRQGYLTLKGSRSGISRPEFEYPIPAGEARELLELFCGEARIRKVRHRLVHRGRRWEIDEFEGRNQGLVLAEVELESPGQSVELPEWIGREVSHEARYYNARLCSRPWKDWPPGDRE